MTASFTKATLLALIALFATASAFSHSGMGTAYSGEHPLLGD